MLFGLEVILKKNNPDKEQINAQCYLRVFTDILPCFLHFFTPVNVVKDKNGSLSCSLQQLMKIPERGHPAVIAIHESKVNPAGVC